MISGPLRTPVKTVDQVRVPQRDGDSGDQVGNTECLIAFHRRDEIEEDENDRGDTKVVEHEQLPEWPLTHNTPFEGNAACSGWRGKDCSL